MQRNLMLIIIFYLLNSSLKGQDKSPQDSLKIGEINIEGNFITSKKFIFRELIFKINDYVVRKDIEYLRQTSINNLTKSTLFNFIEIQTVETSPGILIVNVKLIERWFLWPDLYLNQQARSSARPKKSAPEKPVDVDEWIDFFGLDRTKI